MKKTLLILFLSFCFIIPSQADDIRDFQIEGMSLYESALNYFSEEKIKKNVRKNSYPNSDGKFYDAQFVINSFETYKDVQIVFKKNDKKYLIYAISGGFFFDNMAQCLAKQKKIDKDLKKIFTNANRVESKKRLHKADKTKRSWVKQINYFFKTGTIDLVCYDWNDDFSKDKYILVSIDSPEFDEWLQKAN